MHMFYNIYIYVYTPLAAIRSIDGLLMIGYDILFHLFHSVNLALPAQGDFSSWGF